MECIWRENWILFQLWAIFISCKFYERVWEIIHHPRCCLTHHPGVSSNIIDATHFSTPHTLSTLTHRPLYPHWCTNHVTHADMSPTLARHQHKHTAHLAGLPRKHATYDTHASANSMPFLISLSFSTCKLSNFKRKFSSFYF